MELANIDRQTDMHTKRKKGGKRKSYLHFKHCNPGTIKNKYLWAPQQIQKKSDRGLAVQGME